MTGGVAGIATPPAEEEGLPLAREEIAPGEEPTFGDDEEGGRGAVFGPRSPKARAAPLDSADVGAPLLLSLFLLSLFLLSIPAPVDTGVEVPVFIASVDEATSGIVFVESCSLFGPLLGRLLGAGGGGWGPVGRLLRAPLMMPPDFIDAAVKTSVSPVPSTAAAPCETMTAVCFPVPSGSTVGNASTNRCVTTAALGMRASRS
jgi:hypothetical protein